jgi:phosphomannomutase
MAEISRFFGIVIGMFHREHNPPHFHERYGEHRAAIAIETLSVLEGRLPPRVFGLVVEWTVQHRAEL